jgi:hypothetical protein
LPEKRPVRKRLSPCETEAVIKRILDVLLAWHCFDIYWTSPVSQSDIRAEEMLRDGRVHGGAVRAIGSILENLEGGG